MEMVRVPESGDLYPALCTSCFATPCSHMPRGCLLCSAAQCCLDWWVATASCVPRPLAIPTLPGKLRGLSYRYRGTASEVEKDKTLKKGSVTSKNPEGTEEVPPLPSLGHLLVLAISASLGLLSAFAEQGEKRGDKGMHVRVGPETLMTLAPGPADPQSPPQGLPYPADPSCLKTKPSV